ncbi:hypothetical protein [Amycolatopsis sp. lyj-90]
MPGLFRQAGGQVIRALDTGASGDPVVAGHRQDIADSPVLQFGAQAVLAP